MRKSAQKSFTKAASRRSTSNGTEVNSTQIKNTEALFKLYEDPEVMNTQGKIALQNALADHGKRFDTACTAARCAFDALNPGFIDENGIGKLGQDLGLDPQTDVAILVLVWKLGAKTPGTISKEEFVSGMGKLSCDSIETLKAQLASFDPGWVFQFSREGTMKSIEQDISSQPATIALHSINGTGLYVLLHTACLMCVITTATTGCMLFAFTNYYYNSFLEFSVTAGKDLSDYDDEDSFTADTTAAAAAVTAVAAVKQCNGNIDMQQWRHRCYHNDSSTCYTAQQCCCAKNKQQRMYVVVLEALHTMYTVRCLPKHTKSNSSSALQSVSVCVFCVCSFVLPFCVSNTS
eukprot:17112-Heterococcus_DN1.PRE.2